MTTQTLRAMRKTQGNSEGMSKGEVSQGGRPINLLRISRIGQVTSQASVGLAEGQEVLSSLWGPIGLFPLGKRADVKVSIEAPSKKEKQSPLLIYCWWSRLYGVGEAGSFLKPRGQATPITREGGGLQGVCHLPKEMHTSLVPSQH